MSSINDLSEDLITGIFPFLSPFDLGNLYQVNTKMRDLIVDYIKNITKVVHRADPKIQEEVKKQLKDMESRHSQTIKTVMQQM